MINKILAKFRKLRRSSSESLQAKNKVESNDCCNSAVDDTNKPKAKDSAHGCC